MENAVALDGAQRQVTIELNMKNMPHPNSPGIFLSPMVVDWADQNYAWSVVDEVGKAIESSSEWLALAESAWLLERVDNRIDISAADQMKAKMPKVFSVDVSGMKTMAFDGKRRLVVKKVLEDGCTMHLIRLPEES